MKRYEFPCSCGRRHFVRMLIPGEYQVIDCACGESWAIEYEKRDGRIHWTADRIELEDKRGMVFAILLRRGQN